MDFLIRLLLTFGSQTAFFPIAIMNMDKNEDRDFMTSLFMQYRGRLVQYAMHFCRNRHDAEDAVQNAFLSLVSRVTQLRAMERRQLEGYVFVTVKNAAFLINRKGKSNLLAENGFIESVPVGTNWLTEATVDDVLQALEHLSEKDQILLRMKFFLGSSDQEIAAQIGCKRNSVQKMIARARYRLAAEIQRGERHDD